MKGSEPHGGNIHALFGQRNVAIRQDNDRERNPEADRNPISVARLDRVFESDWLLNEPDEVNHRHIENMVQYSRKVKVQCAKHDVKYFDTSTNFMSTLEQATQYLLAKRQNPSASYTSGLV